VRERGEEFVLAAVGLDQRELRVLEPRDVEVDAGPALDPPGFVADRDALAEHEVILAIDAEKAVLAVPRVPRAGAFLPERHRRFPLVRMQPGTPAVVRCLLLRQPDQLEEGIADVDRTPLRVRDPDAVVDRLPDRAIELLARFERARVRLHFVEHAVERVDDHADLVVGLFQRAERVVPSLHDLARHVGHRLHGLAHHALQPARRE
jgi:hypothetical protein